MKTPEILLILLLVAIVSVVSTKFALNTTISTNNTNNIPYQHPLVIVAPPTNQRMDDRYTRAPRPQRDWNPAPELPVRGALDPVPTRGAPDSYQQMGVLTGPDGKVLPLYGRRTAPRSDYFNYYTRTDTYNPVALPVLYKRKDCQDNQGCSELFNGDEVKLAATGEAAKVTLYGFDGPRYVPDII